MNRPNSNNCPNCGRFIQKILFKKHTYICENCDLIWTKNRKWEKTESYEKYLDKKYEKINI